MMARTTGPDVFNPKAADLSNPKVVRFIANWLSARLMDEPELADGGPELHLTINAALYRALKSA